MSDAGAARERDDDAAARAALAAEPAGASLAHLCHELNDGEVFGDPWTRVRDVRHDSRAVQPGDLFVARRGQRVDGASFVRDAIDRGAAAICADKRYDDLGVPVLVCADVERALAVFASTVWSHPSFHLEVLGITGTNGKTTTAYLLEHALAVLGLEPALLGTVAQRYRGLRFPAVHTTPEADDLARRMAAMKRAGAEHLVMEVSSHALSLQRVAAVRFRCAVLTNVTQDHLDFHGSIESYRDAKRSFFRAHGPASMVLNADDAVGAGLLDEFPDALGYSARGARPSGPAERRWLAVTGGGVGQGGVDVTLATHEGPAALRSSLVGGHNVENLLAALGALCALDVPVRDACEALREAPAAPGRLERVPAQGPSEPAVFVDYAHSPDALERVLAALRPAVPAGGRLWCVFGCGGDRDRTKRPAMGEAVARGADAPVLTTDNPRSEDPAAIADDAAAGLRAAGLRATSIDALAGEGARGGYALELDRAAAIAKVLRAAGPRDVVLVAGKGHETYQEVRGVRAPFDDREHARAALAARGSDEPGAR